MIPTQIGSYQCHVGAHTDSEILKMRVKNLGVKSKMTKIKYRAVYTWKNIKL